MNLQNPKGTEDAPQLLVRNHSLEMMEILDEVPHALVRWGNTAILGGVAVLILTAAWIRYPSLIRAPITLISTRPAVEIEASAGGVFYPLVDDGQEVDQSTPLGVIETTVREHVLSAPAAGRVVVLRSRGSGPVESGDLVLAILPELTGMVGEIELPASMAGRIACGQEVLIRLDAYPSQNYGTVKGQVKSLSPLVRDDFQLLTVILPEGLRTTSGQELEAVERMQGEAEIITGEQSILAVLSGA